MIRTDIKILATVVPGFHGASGAIELQKPLVKEFFPQIEHCKSGTINLALGVPLEVRLPDIVTPPILWRADLPGGGERFGITRIELELPDNARHEAWITPRSSLSIGSMPTWLRW
jgi:hypothetical protein